MVILRLSSNSLTQSNPPQKFRLGWNTFAELLHTLRIASMGISFILGSGHTSDICFCGSTRRLGILAAYLLAKSAWTKQKGKHRKNNWTSKKTRLHPNPLPRSSLDSSLSSSVRTEARLASHAMECNDLPHPYRVGAHSQKRYCNSVTSRKELLWNACRRRAGNRHQSQPPTRQSQHQNRPSHSAIRSSLIEVP